MATKKDLVEAYSFSRRRLVTAFVSGAPGGREVEPNRPGRAIVGGLALAVLLVAGGAVLGIIKSPSTADLDQAGTLVSEKETGADYLVLDKTGGGGTELRPLVNITSAMLMQGPKVTSEKVPRKDLDGEQIGAPIGILDAPATPPGADKLVESGWSACTGVIDADGPTGIKVHISQTPQTTPTPDLTFSVVTSSGDYYVISESRVGSTRAADRAYAYLVPDGNALDQVVQAVTGRTLAEAVPVPDRFITLFPTGGDLKVKTLGLTAADVAEAWPLRDEVPGAEKAQIGDVLVVGSERYLTTRTGTLKLNDFSSALVDTFQWPGDDAPAEIPVDKVAGEAATPVPGANWPTELHTTVPPAVQLCAQLDVSGEQPGVVLATTQRDSSASAVDVPVDSVERSAQSGVGAFVLSGDWSGKGPTSRVLVDARGYAYPVGPGDEKFNLGYGEVPDVIVPQDWLELFQVGVPLTIDAARCPPTSRPGGGCS